MSPKRGLTENTSETTLIILLLCAWARVRDTFAPYYFLSQKITAIVANKTVPTEQS
jgi:hypothetical protein